MRTIDTIEVYKVLKKIIPECLYKVDADAQKAISACEAAETSDAARWALQKIKENNLLAENAHIPSCQDTGMAVVYLEIGQQIILSGEYIEDAVNRAVREAYTVFRKSAADPLTRKNTGDNTPAVIHTKIVNGENIAVRFMAKGFGSENQSRLYMLTPANGREGIINAVLDAVKRAGSLPCPPVMLGIGIGGTMEKCAEIAKEALLRKTAAPHPDKDTAALEAEILARVNALGIGAQGFGGKATCFAVHIETFPTHIAGLPVAVNIQCHAVRHGEAVI